ncbi:guanine deaminase [Alphaproteobacteria bacterium KMM 3653]|uniref:Guanine deaminase n=1 Tax=Harenicola maris TaxID=2841044 RepID=A0AAP2G2P0_9RHOB|nr:guanine deaminase [Harenicola maris]
MTRRTLLLGQSLEFTRNPMAARAEGAPPEDAARHLSHAGVLIEDGLIGAFGEAATLAARYPEAPIIDYGAGLILPGFVDAHVHYAQTGIIASWGKRLIDWLNDYTFPEERRFADPAYAITLAGRYLDLVLANGTTTVASYGTVHAESVTALFQAALARGMAVVAGKTCMDRNAPDWLTDTPQSAYDDSARLIRRWHGQNRATYAVTPRFAPTSSPEQLEVMGALWAENPGTLMQTHLSEQVEEIAWVKDLYPKARDYLDVYETYGLTGPGAVFGHAIHLTDREIAHLSDSGSSVVHCPTSNAFIGSGLFQAARLAKAGITMGLATDTGGGSSFSMLRTMAAAYDISQLAGTPLHPAELLWLATAGAAESLQMQDQVGTLAPGSAADIIVLDLNSTPAIAQRAQRAGDIWGALFPTMMMGDDRALRSVWVSGAERQRQPDSRPAAAGFIAR